MKDNRTNQIQLSGALEAAAGLQAGVVRRTHYTFECYGRPVRGRDERGRFAWSRPLQWSDEFDNAVVTEGLNDSLDKHFKGSSYTAAWYVGITGSAPGFAAGDTMASHAGWVEATAYSDGSRRALTLGTVSGGSVSNSASKAAFTINGTATIGGAFITTGSATSGSTGTLYGGGAFTGGDRAVQSGDTLNVTATLTAGSA